VCLLDVPAHKTGTPFTKPVDPLVGRAIDAWEAVRPTQPRLLDSRTAERVALLFCLRAKRVARDYINQALIPALCRKAGVPRADDHGGDAVDHTILVQRMSRRSGYRFAGKDMRQWL
jgi:hypothetical protein